MSFSHLTKCSARSITTADILYDAVIRDRFPDDEQTREDFGFTRLRHPREESHLLGLYIGLLNYLEVRPMQLNEWREKNILTSKIIEAFNRLPEKSRGGYFPWFLRNQHILDRTTLSSPLRQDGHSDLVQHCIEAAMPYLEPEYRDKCWQHMEPPSKRDCFLVYALLLDDMYPHPFMESMESSDLWYTLGFAVCRGTRAESRLGNLYSHLIGGDKKALENYEWSLGSKIPIRRAATSRCTFGELWEAWQSGRLPGLFDKYGLGGDLDSDFPHAREFLSVPAGRCDLHPSVWKLQHFLAIQNSDATTLAGGHGLHIANIKAAAEEYDFTPQLDARSRVELQQLYQKLLDQGDPIEVHIAKERGQLLAYAAAVLGCNIDGGVQNVLRTIGPTRKKSL